MTYTCLNCESKVKEEDVKSSMTMRFASDLEPTGLYPEITDYCPVCGCEFDFFIDEEMKCCGNCAHFIDNQHGIIADFTWCENCVRNDSPEGTEELKDEWEMKE